MFSVLEVEELRCIMVDSARGGWQGVLDLTVGHLATLGHHAKLQVL